MSVFKTETQRESSDRDNEKQRVLKVASGKMREDEVADKKSDQQVRRSHTQVHRHGTTHPYMTTATY